MRVTPPVMRHMEPPKAGDPRFPPPPPRVGTSQGRGPPSPPPSRWNLPREGTLRLPLEPSDRSCESSGWAQPKREEGGGGLFKAPPPSTECWTCAWWVPGQRQDQNRGREIVWVPEPGPQVCAHTCREKPLLIWVDLDTYVTYTYVSICTSTCTSVCI